MIDPAADFEDISLGDVDATIARVKELAEAGEVEGDETEQQTWESVAMRIAIGGGDVDDFTRKLDATLTSLGL